MPTATKQTLQQTTVTVTITEANGKVRTHQRTLNGCTAAQALEVAMSGFYAGRFARAAQE